MRFHGGAESGVLDFSSNINPLAPPSFVTSLIRDCDYSRYPDYNYHELTNTIANFHGVNPSSIVPTNGASEGLYASLAAARLLGFQNCIIVSPNYGDLEFEEYCSALGFRVRHHLMVMDGARFSIGNVEVSKSDVVLLSNPSNPTGVLHCKGSLMSILNDAGLIIVDEAYINLSTNPNESLLGYGNSNLVVIRSLTKELGLPGLRIGYVYSGNDPLISRLKVILPSWNVNSCAEYIARLTLGKYANDYVRFLEESRAKISEWRSMLMDGLVGLGFKVYESSTNYVLTESPINAHELGSKLLERGIAIRLPVGFIGLGERHIRIAVRGSNDVERLLSEIRGIMEGV